MTATGSGDATWATRSRAIRFGRADLGTAGRVLAGLGLLLLLVAMHRHFRWTMVIGESMRPTFSTGDVLMVSRHAYDAEPIRRGDVVLARYRGSLMVKRVVGLPGETVELERGILRIDGRAVSEGHTLRPGDLSIGRGRLGVGRYALLGDNRALSVRETVHAVVASEDILGRVVGALRLWRRSTSEDA